MTVNTCLSFADGLYPNAVPREVKSRWLAELDGRIKVELLRQEPESVQETEADGEMTVPFPYDQIYWMYLAALLAYTGGDTARYETGAALFNTAYRSYAKYLMRAGR